MGVYSYFFRLFSFSFDILRGFCFWVGRESCVTFAPSTQAAMRDYIDSIAFRIPRGAGLKGEFLVRL